MPNRSPDPIPALLDAVGGRGVVMLLGAVDTGKTTLARELANAAVLAGIATAIVDSDIGQSEIGPPGTIGLARVHEPVESLDALTPSALAFVGSTSPARHLLPMVVGTKRLVERARAGGAELVLVDTSGLIEGELAQALKLHKIDLVAPDLVVAIQRTDELEPLLRCVTTGIRVQRLPVPAAARPKSEAFRRVRRASRFHRYFEAARSHELDALAMPVVGAWLFTGEAMEPRLLKFAERTLEAPVLYGERLPGAIHLVTRARPEERRLAALREEFRSGRVVLTPPHTFSGLLVGLMQEGGFLAAAGTLEAVAYDAARLTIRAPLLSLARVCQIRFGRLRLRPDGSEIGLVRPGDL